MWEVQLQRYLKLSSSRRRNPALPARRARGGSGSDSPGARLATAGRRSKYYFMTVSIPSVQQHVVCRKLPEIGLINS